MSLLDNKQLLNLIRYAPVVVVFVFALAVNLIAIKDNRDQAELSIQNLREELILQRKDSIRSQVHQVYKQVLLEKSQSESELKDLSKQRVYEAFGIANHIYAQNLGKPKAEVSKLIVEALRPIRFFDGRGYFFIIANDGTVIMNSAHPSLEGKNAWNLQNSRGHFITRKMLKLTGERNEGPLKWHYKKPDSIDDQETEKVGYLKKFEPYNWSIGTGEYLTDFEEGVKTSLLKWFSGYEYGDNGYFFVIQRNGTLLAHHRNDFLGLNLSVGSKLDHELMKNISTQVKNGGGYVRFSKPLTLSGNASLEQVSYVKEIKEWNWIIGTGFSAQTFEKHIREKEEQLIELNNQSLIRLVYLTIISMVLLTFSSLYVGNLIARRFGIFQSKIKADFTELNNTKNKMEYMALHDALTGLPNRILMLRDIEEKIQLSNRKGEKLAIMFVDLDNFKNVNDLYGHYAGDLLLEVVAERFKAFMDLHSSVSRFGGDEFVFCFSSLKNKAEAQAKVKLINEALFSPVIIEGRTLNVSCTIGVSMCPDDSVNPETLISQADTVLYKSKADKKGDFLFYSNCISKQIKRKMNIQNELLHAIEKDQLSLHYQPQMRAIDKKLVGVEALIRWKHPTLGDIFPDEFVSIAEETGGIHELGLFVFRRACEDICALSSNEEDAINLSVNISPVQLLEPDFGPIILDICHDVGIDPKRITLELTENIFIHRLDVVKPLLSKLRELGFALSLDDFGTGYSSLSYINSLPLTEIKIDRSFINKFLEIYQSDMLVRMIIEIGRLCGLLVVAEGVETKEQFQKLLSYGCNRVQGYYFARPLTIETLSETIAIFQSENESNHYLDK
ncbi:bifunctional diguanylate cyclase/phosphodiesterase [Marinomonas posidonica]|uniref:Diguanylate cyclase/phosphodiesterase n=1 Tax=Marinomonas posidonica (strain CECT 7376 / NCIMB 14433 / IVIA-Po-181) TaxID=491952 RepID=F6CXW1_MARPP|nr:cache domain-containing protein [Marinomonas posidonica]AEF54523.1 diguanylate cyclase/phosphodiesterase [Marinomonas posidonica IVIA-Po-181]